MEMICLGERETNDANKNYKKKKDEVFFSLCDVVTLQLKAVCRTNSTAMISLMCLAGAWFSIPQNVRQGWAIVNW